MSAEKISGEIERLQRRLELLDREREMLIRKIKTLRFHPDPDVQRTAHGSPEGASIALGSTISTATNAISNSRKLSLFRTLFRGREDVYPRRWTNAKTGRNGYSPACRNEWIRGVCEKPRIKCTDCPNQAFLPVTDDVIKRHLQDTEVSGSREGPFVAGVYPLMLDETCWFLAADFDKQSWQRDAMAFASTCRSRNVPAVVERSRSGNGAHVWIFFSEPVPAIEARKLGAHLVTETMERRPDIGFDSYDRFFPSQDTMPLGGFGNLIALPLQGQARRHGNSVFIDDDFKPYEDQWAYLSTVRRMSRAEVLSIVAEASSTGRILGVRLPVDDDDEQPWTAPPSRRRAEPIIVASMPLDGCRCGPFAHAG